MRDTTTKLRAELDALEEEGQLTVDGLIDFAKEHPESEAHKKFEWDDTEAAIQYRRVQARDVITVHVRYIEMASGRAEVPVYMSSAPVTREVGYRRTEHTSASVIIACVRRDLIAVLKRWRGAVFEATTIEWPSDEHVLRIFSLDLPSQPTDRVAKDDQPRA